MSTEPNPVDSALQSPAASPAPAPAADAKPSKVKARVLVGCAYGQPNDVVLLDRAAAAMAEKNGEIDTTKAAVAYAESLRKPTKPSED